jgi:hypothetical protein
MSHANVVVKQEENIASGVPRTMNIALQRTIRVTNEVASYVSFKSATMLLHTLFFTDESIQPWRMTVYAQEAKYVESWPSTTSAWAGWSRFDIPVDRYAGVHSLLRWPMQNTGVFYLPLG